MIGKEAVMGKNLICSIVLGIPVFATAIIVAGCGCCFVGGANQESDENLRVCLLSDDQVRLPDGRLVGMIGYSSFKHYDYATNGNRKVVIDWKVGCCVSNLCLFCRANHPFETVPFSLRDCEFKHYDIGMTIWPHESCFVVRMDANGAFPENCWRLNRYAICDWERYAIEHGYREWASSSRVGYENSWIDRRIVKFENAVSDRAETTTEALVIVSPSSVGLDRLRQSIALARRSWHKEIYVTDTECGMNAWKEQVAKGK